MKGLIVFLIAMLLPLFLKANERCQSLFQIKSDVQVHGLYLKVKEVEEINYDSFLSPSNTLEEKYRAFTREHNLLAVAESEGSKDLPGPAAAYPRVREANIFKLLDSTKDLDSESIKKELIDLEFLLKGYQADLNKIRALDDSVTKITISAPNFSAKNIERIYEVLAAYTYFTVAYLKSKKIIFSIRNTTVGLVGGSMHYLGQLAQRAVYKSFFSVSVDPLSLLEHGASGLYYSHGRITHLRAEALYKPSFYQYDVVLHEYTHHLNHVQKSEGYRKPYNSYIEILSTTPERAAALRVYKKGFSIDEIKAFRASLKAIIHEALTSKEPSVVEEKFNSVLMYTNLEVALSEVTRDVFAENISSRGKGMDSLDWLHGIVRLSNETYKIEERGIVEHIATYDLAQFAFELFSAIQIKLIENQAQTPEKKIDVLKRINQVLVIPEVRKMDGNYPSMQKIKSILED